MPLEVVAHYRGGRCSVTFDCLPTYATFRRALAVDVVGGDDFSVVGLTQRGSEVVIKDQATFIRALGPRNELRVDIRDDAAAASPKTRTVPALSNSTPQPSAGLPCGFATEVCIGSVAAQCLAFVAETRQLWVGEKESPTISVRNPHSGSVVTLNALGKVQGPQFGCLCLLYDTGRIWAGFNSKQIVVWDALTTAELGVLREHSGAVTALAAAGDSVFSASTDFTILQWHKEHRVVTKLLSLHRNGVRVLSQFFTPSPRLVSGGDDRSLVVWHIETGEPIAELPNAHQSSITAIGCVDAKLWTGDGQGTIKVWQITANGSAFALEGTIRDHDAPITVIVGLHARVVTCSGNGKSIIYDSTSLMQLGELHSGRVTTALVAEHLHLFRLWTGSGASLGRREAEHHLCCWRVEDGGVGAIRPLSLSVVRTDPTEAQLQIARFQIDRATEKTLIAAEEARLRTELVLTCERSLCRRFFVLASSTSTNFVDAAIHSHRALGDLVFAAHCAALALAGSLVHGATTHAAVTDAIYQRQLALLEDARTDLVLQKRRISAELTSTQDELAAVHEIYEAQSQECSMAKKERDAFQHQLRHAVADAQRTMDEVSVLQKRCVGLEEELHRAHDALLCERREHESRLAVVEAKAAERDDAAKAALHEMTARAEAAERETRRQTSALDSRIEQVAALERKLSKNEQDNREAEARWEKSRAEDKAFWQSQIDALSDQLSSVKRDAASARAVDADTLSRAHAELRETKHQLHSALEEGMSSTRRYERLQLEAADEAASYRRQVEEARAARAFDNDRHEEALADKAAALAAADAAVRDAAHSNVELKASNGALIMRLELADQENARLRDQIGSLTAMCDAKVTALEGSLAMVKQELSAAESTVGAERAAKIEAERRQQAAEESLEAARRRHLEALNVAADERKAEVAAVTQRLRSTDDQALHRERELLGEIDASQRKLQAANITEARLVTDVARLEEQLSRLKTQAASDAARVTTLSEELTAARADAECRRRESEEATARYERALRQKEVESQQQAATLIAATDDLRSKEHAYSRAVAERDAAYRAAETTTADAERAKQCAAAATEATERIRREAFAAEELTRKEIGSLRDAVAEALADRDAAQQASREAEATLGTERADHARTSSRLSAAQSEWEAQRAAFRAEIRELEAAVTQHRTAVSRAEADVSCAKLELATELETARRQHRVALDEAFSATDRAEAAHRRAQQTALERASECARLRDAEERLRQQYEQAIGDSATTVTHLRSQLQEAKTDAASERDRLTKEMSQLQHVVTALEGELRQAKVLAESAAEERRTADRRFADHVEQQKANFEKELAAAQSAFAAAKAQMQSLLDESTNVESRLRTELRDAKEGRQRVEDSAAGKERQYAATVRDLEARLDSATSDSETARQTLIRASANADEAAAKAKREADVAASLVTRQQRELSELQAKLRQQENLVVQTRLEADRESRRAADTQQELRRVEERATAEKASLEARITDLQSAVERARGEAAIVRDALDEAKMLMSRNAREAADAAERALVAQDDAARWKAAAASAADERDRSIGDAAAARTAAEAKAAEQQHVAHTKLRELADKLRAKDEALATSNRNAEEAQRTVAEVQRRLDAAVLEWREREAAISRELAETAQRHERMSVELLEAQAVARRREEEKRSLSDHNTALLQEHRRLEAAFVAESGARTASASELRREKSAMSDERDTARAEVKRLEAELAQAQVDVEAARARSSALSASLSAAEETIESKRRLAEGSAAAADSDLRRRASHADSLASEIQALAADLRAERAESVRLRIALDQADELLVAVRTELGDVATRYRAEVEAHASTKRSVAVTALASPNRRAPDSGLSSQIFGHVAEMTQGISEATRLLRSLGDIPPRVPDKDDLVCVHEWLQSAKTRGDIILRSFKTQ